ncbi:MAG: VWA domain-containing protein [Acidobacteriota bacterium]
MKWMLPVLVGILLVPSVTAQFADTTDVVLVEIPVVVTHDGEALRGLTKANFALESDGDEQAIFGVEMVDLLDPEAQVPSAAQRHVLFVFDLGFSTPESLAKARGQVARTLDALHASDLIGVALFIPTRGARMVLNFTSDRSQVEVALASLGAPALIETADDPLGLVLGELGSVENADGEVVDWLSAIADSEVDARTRVIAMTRSFADFARALAPIEGSKEVFFFSEGFDGALLTRTGGGRSGERAAEAGELWMVGEMGTESFEDDRLEKAFDEMIESVRRAGMTMQLIDIGEQSRGFRANDGLTALARDSGGSLYESVDTFSAALPDILGRSSVRYVVSYQPKDLKLDGMYRELEIDLVDAPRGARIAHRAGYYAPTPHAQKSALQRQVSSASLLLANEASGQIDASVLAAPFPISGEEAYVPVLVEVSGDSLIGDQEDLPLEIFLYARDQDGGIHDFLPQTLGLDLKQHGKALEERGLKFWGHLDLDPGSYRVQVLVRNSATGHHATRQVMLEVPAFEQGETTLLPPFFPEQPGIWLLAREGEERQRANAPYPFLNGEQPFIPAVRPRVAGDGKTSFVIQGFHLDNGVDVVADLFDHTGTSMGDRAEVDVVGTWTVQDGKQTIDAVLETDDLDAGFYRLDVSTTETGGAAQHASLWVEVAE